MDKIAMSIKNLAKKLERVDLSDKTNVTLLKRQTEKIHNILERLEYILIQLDDTDPKETIQKPSAASKYRTDNAMDSHRIPQKKSIETNDAKPFETATARHQTTTVRRASTLRLTPEEAVKPIRKQREIAPSYPKNEPTTERAISLNLIPQDDRETVASTDDSYTTLVRDRDFPLSNEHVKNQEYFHEDILGQRSSGKNTSRHTSYGNDAPIDPSKKIKTFRIDTSKITVGDRMGFITLFFNRNKSDYEKFIERLKNEVYSTDALHQTLLREAKLRNWPTESSMFQTFQNVLASSVK